MGLQREGMSGSTYYRGGGPAILTIGSADRLLVRQLGDAGHDEIDELVRRVAHPLVAPLVQVGLGEGDEGEAAVDEVRLRLVVDVRRHEARLRVKLGLGLGLGLKIGLGLGLGLDGTRRAWG